MHQSKLAVQLFTLREHLKTPEDIAASLKKVAAQGWQAVQVSGMGPIPEAELVGICEGEGLTICATHEGSDTILAEPNKVVDRLAALNCVHTAYPYPRDVDMGSAEDVAKLVAGLEASGAVLREAGQVLSYHNHGLEYRKLPDSRTTLATIYAETSAENLKAELDTYWVHTGGADVVEEINGLAGRQPLIHLKDYGIGPDNQPVMMEIGNGNLNWDRIIPAAEKAGVEWFIVEQDRTPGDPFESLAQSWAYLQRFCAS